MAAIARRTWATIKTEVARRSGRTSDTADTATNGPIEHLIEAVYRDLCLLYHHFELDKTATNQAIASGATSLALPADCYAVIGVLLKSFAGTEIGRLKFQEAGYLLGSRTATAAQPKDYTRFGQTLYFPAPADVAYKADVYYYSQPTAPDFSSGSPAFDRLWDEHLIQGATDLVLRGHWAADQGAPQAESLASFLSRVVNPPLAEGGLLDFQDRANVNRSHGGAQG